ncbi:dynein regulatory complex subunit 3 [Lepisosteus oculatus]|uniref:dynein regulatory complex subunit 3 n=1 Tax=Lepisosteus oculatus TaxID=7918 RepID=UPI0035F50059
MSRLYDTVEPSVVDEQMLQKAVEEQGPQDQAGSIAKEEGIQYGEVCQLRLDYRNILKIDHLWQFTALTKLQLDNNIIEKIEGLDCLTNLVWLDLSFNNIEVIEGLDSLVKLEDLSLYNNRISVIENMDSLQQLQVLSLGNNCLAQLDNVVYLRRLKRLRTLNLAGNPVHKDENYKTFITAYLPNLVYLDFRLLDEQTREVACVQYQYAIEEMTQNEAQEAQTQAELRRQAEELQLHKAACVEFLNGSFLFDSMFMEDPEAAKLAYLPGVAQLLDSYKSQFVAYCQQVFEVGLAQHKRREADVSAFFDCVHDAVKDNQERAAQKVATFEKSRREVLGELQQLSDARLLETRLAESSEEVNQLCDCLMTLELQLVDQLEDIIKDFERTISDMVNGFIEVVQGIFTQCRDLENNHHEKLLEIAVATLEKVAKNELEEDMPDDVRMLFVDKDTVINAVSASHDTHLLKIDNREDELVTRINAWTATLVEKIHNQEVQRNRKRVSEIHNYIDYLKDQLDDLGLQEAL